MLRRVDRASLIRAGLDACRVRFLGDRRPLAARIQVTRRCPLRCRYCHPPDEHGREMSTGQILDVMEQLRALGCLRVSLSGGEPMNREDIGELVDGCAALGMAPEMNSCGVGFADRVQEVRRLKLLKLSLDGPRHVHDELRGKDGTYHEVLRALKAAVAAGIRTVLVATVTRHNVDVLEHVLGVARRHGAMAAFQPIKPYYRGASDVQDILPEPAAMQGAVRRLEHARIHGHASILRNSRAGLQHLSRWPVYGPLRCWSGRIFCIVGAGGTLYPCDRTRIDEPLPSCLELGVERALALLPDPECDGCGFCGALELNFALALDLRVVSTIVRLVR